MCRQLHQAADIAKSYKYTIWLQWQKLTPAEQRKAKQLLSDLLNITPRTFDNWMYFKTTDNKTVPAESLYQLATFFGCEVQQMWTDPPVSLHIEYAKMQNELRKDSAGLLF